MPPLLQGALSEPIIKVRVLFCDPLYTFEYTIKITVIICHYAEIPITNKKGFIPLVVMLKDLLAAEG